MKTTLALVYKTIIVAGTIVALIAGVVSIIGAAHGNPDVVIDFAARLEVPSVTVNVELDALSAEDIAEIVEAARLYTDSRR